MKRNPSINELIEIGENALSEGKKYGAEEIEIYLQHSRNYRANVDTGYVDTYGGQDFGVGIRATIGKKVGFASATVNASKEIRTVIKKATKIAKIKEEDPHFHHLPDPQAGAGGTSIVDDEIVSLNLGDLTKLAKRSSEKGKRVGDFVENISVMAVAGIEKKAIVSTRGINRGDKGSFLVGFANVKGKRNGELTKGSESVFRRTMTEEKLLNLGKNASQEAETMFGGKTIDDPFTGQLVIKNKNLYSFLWPLIYNVNADNVADERSRFTEKKGETIASDITIIDDGTLPEGMNTAEVDDEGVPMTKKTIIQKGTLQNYLFNNYAALRMGEKSTGNALRGDYNSTPSLSQTNLSFKTGSGDYHDLQKEIDRGVLVTGNVMGSHLTNPLKGNFGLTCKNAFYVENGEIQYPLKEVTVSGNFFEFLKNIIKVGNDTELVESGKLPSILAKEIEYT